MNDLRPLKRKSCSEVAAGNMIPEFKADAIGTIEGYASIFGNVDAGGDIVAPGAFGASLAKKPKVKMLWQHDTWSPIGVWDEIKEDQTGLWVRGRILSDVELGREAIALVKSGAIDGLSVGYRTVEASKSAEGNRILERVDLWEISLVTFPMNSEATIDAMKAATMSKRNFENALRDAGLSKSVRGALMHGGWDSVQALRDAGDEDYSELLDSIQASSLLNLLS